MRNKHIEWKPVKAPIFSKILVDRTGKSYNYHPIIILEIGEDLIFIKAKSARYGLDKNNNEVLYKDDKKILEENKGILITETVYDGKFSSNDLRPLFSNDSIVDTTQLYIMSKKDFQKFYDLDKDETFYNTNSLAFNERIEILDKVINNINKKQISLTSIYYDENQDIKTKLIYSSNELLDDDINNRKEQILSKYSENKITQKDMDLENQKLDKCKENYEKYINNDENLKCSLNKLNLISKKMDEILKETLSNCSWISNESDSYYYSGTAEFEYGLQLDQKIYNEFSNKEYDQEVKWLTLSSYKKDYYNEYPEEIHKDFPDAKEEYHNYLKRLCNIKNFLEKTEDINNKNIRNDFNKLKKDFDKAYQHEILTNDVLDEYDNKINEIDKSLNKDQGMTL